MDCHRHRRNPSAAEGLSRVETTPRGLRPIAVVVALMTELDPLRRSFRMQVMRVVFMIGLKAHLGGRLG